MSDLANTNKDESNVDFTDDVQKPEEQMTMEELDKIRESIDTQGEEEMNRVKKLAEEVLSWFVWLIARIKKRLMLPFSFLLRMITSRRGACL